MDPFDNPLLFAVVCFGFVGPFLGLGFLLPNTGAFLATVFSMVLGEEVSSKRAGKESGTSLKNPNDLDEFKKA